MDRSRNVISALVAAHVVLAVFTSVRLEYLVFDAAMLALAFSARTRRLALLCLPLWLSGVLYESHHLLFVFQGEVRVTEVRALESLLFAAPGGGTWPEWFWRHNHPILDALCGLTYLLYIPQVFAVGIALLVCNRDRCRRFAWAFLALNALGIAIYLTYPVAPPWYVLQHGTGPADLATAGNAAGALRFDELFDVSVFADFYARAPNVFGAMPSLHVAYPVLGAVLCFGAGRALRVATIAFASVMALSAVYLTHHYILDAIAGASLAVVVGTIALRVRGLRSSS